MKPSNKMEIFFLFFISRFVIFHSLSSRSKAEVKVFLCVQAATRRGWNTIFHSKKLKTSSSLLAVVIIFVCQRVFRFAFFGVSCHWERNAFLQNKNNNFCFHQLCHNRATQANWKAETSLVTYFPKSSRNGSQQKHNQISKQSSLHAQFWSFLSTRFSTCTRTNLQWRWKSDFDLITDFIVGKTFSLGEVCYLLWLRLPQRQWWWWSLMTDFYSESSGLNLFWEVLSGNDQLLCETSWMCSLHSTTPLGPD